MSSSERGDAELKGYGNLFLIVCWQLLVGRRGVEAEVVGLGWDEEEVPDEREDCC